MPRLDIDPPQRVKDILNAAHAEQVDAEKARAEKPKKERGEPVTVQLPRRMLDVIIASDEFAALVESMLANPVAFGKRG